MAHSVAKGVQRLIDIFLIVHIKGTQNLLNLLVSNILQLTLASHMVSQQIHFFNCKVIISFTIGAGIDKIK